MEQALGIIKCADCITVDKLSFSHTTATNNS